MLLVPGVSNANSMPKTDLCSLDCVGGFRDKCPSLYELSPGNGVPHGVSPDNAEALFGFLHYCRLFIPILKDTHASAKLVAVEHMEGVKKEYLLGLFMGPFADRSAENPESLMEQPEFYDDLGSQYSEWITAFYGEETSWLEDVLQLPSRLSKEPTLQVTERELTRLFKQTRIPSREGGRMLYQTLSAQNLAPLHKKIRHFFLEKLSYECNYEYDFCDENSYDKDQRDNFPGYKMVLDSYEKNLGKYHTVLKKAAKDDIQALALMTNLGAIINRGQPKISSFFSKRK